MLVSLKILRLLKTVLILIIWLLVNPADQDPHCLVCRIDGNLKKVDVAFTAQCALIEVCAFIRATEASVIRHNLRNEPDHVILVLSTLDPINTDLPLTYR